MMYIIVLCGDDMKSLKLSCSFMCSLGIEVHSFAYLIFGPEIYHYNKYNKSLVVFKEIKLAEFSICSTFSCLVLHILMRYIKVSFSSSSFSF